MSCQLPHHSNMDPIENKDSWIMYYFTRGTQAMFCLMAQRLEQNGTVTSCSSTLPYQQNRASSSYGHTKTKMAKELIVCMSFHLRARIPPNRPTEGPLDIRLKQGVILLNPVPDLNSDQTSIHSSNWYVLWNSCKQPNATLHINELEHF